MEGRRLILNDGTVIENGQAGLSDGFLWLWMPGETMQDVAGFVFTSAMEKVVFQYGDEAETYEGFTVCTNLMQDGGEIAVCMAKG